MVVSGIHEARVNHVLLVIVYIRGLRNIELVVDDDWVLVGRRSGLYNSGRRDVSILIFHLRTKKSVGLEWVFRDGNKWLWYSGYKFLWVKMNWWKPELDDERFKRCCWKKMIWFWMRFWFWRLKFEGDV